MIEFMVEHGLTSGFQEKDIKIMSVKIVPQRPAQNEELPF